MTRHPTARTVVAVRHLLVALALVGCTDTERGLVSPDLQAAKGGGGPSVTAATPPYGNRGESGKQVTITGSGFATGDQASWERNGAADPKIQVVSTQFVSSTQLIATINIAVDADLALYDIAIIRPGRKGGIGTMLFEVTTVTLLPELNGQGGLAKDINEGGEIVGYTDTQAIRWDLSGAFEDLGPGQATSIDLAGTTIVGSTSIDLGATQASLWTGGAGARTRTLLSAPCATGPVVTSMASAVSANGTFAGGWLRISTSTGRKSTTLLRPVLWNLALGGCTLLPIPVGAVPGPTVKDVNSLGMGTGHGVFWDASGAATLLSTWPGDPYALSYGITGDGNTIVGRTGNRAVYWRRISGIWSQPIELPSGTCSSGNPGQANDVSDSELIVGRGCDGAAWYWQLSTGVVTASGRLPGLGPLGAGDAQAVRNSVTSGEPGIVGGAKSHPVFWPLP